VKVTNEVNIEMMAAAKKAGIEFIKLSPQDEKKIDEILYKESQKKAAELDAKKYPGTAILQDLRKAAGIK